MINKSQISVGIKDNVKSPIDHPIRTYNSSELKFRSILNEQIHKSNGLQISKHAKERIAQRNIEMNEDLINSLNDAAEIARLKGAKDIVMIGDDVAFVVNIPNEIIVTAVTTAELKNNVFTNIDSAVLI